MTSKKDTRVLWGRKILTRAYTQNLRAFSKNFEKMLFFIFLCFRWGGRFHKFRIFQGRLELGLAGWNSPAHAMAKSGRRVFGVHSPGARSRRRGRNEDCGMSYPCVDVSLCHFSGGVIKKWGWGRGIGGWVFSGRWKKRLTTGISVGIYFWVGRLESNVSLSFEILFIVLYGFKKKGKLISSVHIPCILFG